jgi:hypothetical protein
MRIRNRSGVLVGGQHLLICTSHFVAVDHTHVLYIHWHISGKKIAACPVTFRHGFYLQNNSTPLGAHCDILRWVPPPSQDHLRRTERK